MGYSKNPVDSEASRVWVASVRIGHHQHNCDRGELVHVSLGFLLCFPLARLVVVAGVAAGEKGKAWQLYLGAALWQECDHITCIVVLVVSRRLSHLLARGSPAL